MINAFLALVFLAAGQTTQTLDLKTLQHRLDTEDARSVVGGLSRSGQWDAVERHIGAGDTAWIALAPRLSKGTDAATSEGLGISLAEALPRNPHAVLSILNGRVIPLSPQTVCSAPFLEGTPVDIPAYRARTLKALEAVSDRHLASTRKVCIAMLHQ